MVDVATAWSERAAILGRSCLVVEHGFNRILGCLPFPVREVHPDNGSEFFNHHMLRFWDGLEPEIRLSRSRPYHKSDNRFVEQKNSTLVRAYLGYDRLDTVAQTLAVNQLYDLMWLYYNFFQPVMRLSQKTWLQEEGHPPQLKRRFDDARTPFDRLCKTESLPQQQQEQLQALRDRTNPRQLRQEIYALIDHISSLPGAVPGLTGDVRLTLMTSASSQQADDSLPAPALAGPTKEPGKEGDTVR